MRKAQKIRSNCYGFFEYFNQPSADAAEGGAGDERYERAGAVDVFAQRVKPLAYGLARAEVDGHHSSAAGSSLRLL